MKVEGKVGRPADGVASEGYEAGEAGAGYGRRRGLNQDDRGWSRADGERSDEQIRADTCGKEAMRNRKRVCDCLSSLGQENMSCPGCCYPECKSP